MNHGMVCLVIAVDSVMYCEGEVLWVRANDIRRVMVREVEIDSEEPRNFGEAYEPKYREEGSTIWVQVENKTFDIFEIKASPQELLGEMATCHDNGTRRRGPKKRNRQMPSELLEDNE